MKTETTFSRPVRIVVIGAGNRAHKYLEYARRNPEQLRLAAIVEVNDLRRRAMADAFGLPDKYCYAHYDDFFAERLDADMVLISTPENAHFDPAVKAIDAGYHVLLEKPIAQRLDECREIASQRLAGTAAICGAEAAELYGLEILERGIETNKHNFTRFLVLADRSRAAEFTDPVRTDKASLVFTLPHTQGSLSKVLTLLSFYGINLTKIQSLPIIGREWEYRFYVDVTFDDPVRYRQAVDAARPLTSDFRILGEYAEYPNPEI